MDKYQYRAVADLLEAFETMDAEERKEVINRVGENYCLKCFDRLTGAFKLCFCEADE